MAEDDGELKPEEHNATSDEGHGHQRQSFKQRWRRLTIGNQIVAISNVLIAATTGLYVLVSILTWITVSGSSKETSRQAGDLIKAANIQAGAATKNAQAASSFAASADGIKHQTELAVNNFQRMANASEESIRTIQKTANDALNFARTGQQAWVGVTDPMVDSVTYESGNIVVMGHHKLKNFGLSPAFKVYPTIMLAPDIVGIDEAARTSCMSAKEWFEFKTNSVRKATQNREQGFTIFPGQELSGIQFQANATPSRPPSGALWLIGCMYYRDELGNTRYTKCCLVTSEQPRQQSSPFQRCTMYEKAE